MQLSNFPFFPSSSLSLSLSLSLFLSSFSSSFLLSLNFFQPAELPNSGPISGDNGAGRVDKGAETPLYGANAALSTLLIKAKKFAGRIRRCRLSPHEF